jgi:uncharacterized Zn finger protein (UPF0148 family)
MEWLLVIVLCAVCGIKPNETDEEYRERSRKERLKEATKLKEQELAAEQLKARREYEPLKVDAEMALREAAVRRAFNKHL